MEDIRYIAGITNNNTERSREKPFTELIEAICYIKKQMQRKFGKDYTNKIEHCKRFTFYYYTDKECDYEFYIRKETRDNGRIKFENIDFVL